MKKKRTKRASYWNIAAKTTSKDWGFGPVSDKGGKTTNAVITKKGKDKS